MVGRVAVEAHDIADGSSRTLRPATVVLRGSGSRNRRSEPESRAITHAGAATSGPGGGGRRERVRQPAQDVSKYFGVA